MDKVKQKINIFLCILGVYAEGYGSHCDVSLHDKIGYKHYNNILRSDNPIYLTMLQ